MKLWKENKVNKNWSVSNTEIAKLFLKSEYGKNPYEHGGKARALVYFITAKDGLNSTFEFDEKKGSIDGSRDILEILGFLK